MATMVIWTSPAAGQDGGRNPDGKKMFQRVTLLPVGDFPVGGAKIVNGYPVMVVPKPSELIPTPVYVKEGKEYKSLGLIMNSPSANWRLPAGGVIEVLTQKDGQYDKYMTVKLPEEKEDVTIFMLRNKQSMSWVSDPRTVILKNGIESFPLGSVRLINFSDGPAQAVVGTNKLTIPPHAFRVVKDPGTKNGEVFFTYQISAEINGRNAILASTAVSYDKRSRINLLIYKRDGSSEIELEGGNSPLKFVKYFELPYQPPTEAPSAAAIPAVAAPAAATP